MRAWDVALGALGRCDAAARRLGRSYGPLADQLRRASQSACLQLAEAAAKGGAERAQRLRGARAEASEAAAALEAAAVLGLLPAEQVAEAMNELGRLCAMLVKLERAA
ncbi:MAG: four helix bundle protein [Proteobacteria bacterium]|nr:four helix bundle protein [Pseudomonadota bacterium]